MMRAFAWCSVVLAGLLGSGSSAGAQTVIDHRAWATISAQMPIGKSPWRLTVESFWRSREGVGRLDSAAVRPILTYALDKHSSVGGGYALAPSFPASGGITIEHRVFGQYVWTGGAAGGTLSSRTRLEARFIEGNSGVLGRFREQIRFAHPVKAGSRTSFVGYDELFIHLNTTTRSPRGVDQNRVFAGVSQTLNKTTRIEIGYLNQFSPGHNAADKMNHVLSGTLVLTF